MEAIFSRRSIRKYTDQEITNDEIKAILKAGMAAPSCKSSCEWIFIVMKDRSRFGRFLEVHPFAKALNTGMAVVLVCADLNLEKEPGEGWWIQDCSAAMENMLIQATDLNIGSLWLGVHPKKERITFVRELCDLPEHVEPFAMLVLGIPERDKEPINRYLDDHVFFDKYGTPWKQNF